MVEPHVGSVLSCSTCSRLRCSFLGAITHCTSGQLGTTGNPAVSDITPTRSIATFCTLSSLVKDPSAVRSPGGGSNCGGARIAISKILSMPFNARHGKILVGPHFGGWIGPSGKLSAETDGQTIVFAAQRWRGLGLSTANSTLPSRRACTWTVRLVRFRWRRVHA